MVNATFQRSEAGRRPRALLFAASGLAALSAASCAAVGDRDATPASPPAFATPSGPPRYASYDCGGLGAMTVENFQTSALVVPPDGPSAELPARPPGQSRAFRSGGQALLLEEGRAVLSRPGQPDLVCAG